MTISATEDFVFKIGNKVVYNIFSTKGSENGFDAPHGTIKSTL